MEPRVIVIGSSNTDMIIGVPILPEPGQTVVGSDFRMLPGGKGANQAVAAARMGADVTFVAALGDDSFGDDSLHRLTAEGIDTSCIVRKPGVHSGVAMIYVDPCGENVIAISPGANNLLTPDDVRLAKEAIAGASMVILQLEIPIETAIAAAKMAKEARCTVLLNPAPISSGGLPDELLAYTNILTPNRGELLMIAPEAGSIEDAAHSIISRGPHLVVVTMGQDGATAFARDQSLPVPAIEIKAVDTVGAGDCFTAALGVMLAEGSPLDDAVRCAVAASGLSTLVSGAQDGMPHRAAVMARLRDGR